MLLGIGKNREVGAANLHHFANRLAIANAGLEALGYQAALRAKESKGTKHYLSTRASPHDLLRRLTRTSLSQQLKTQGLSGII